MGSLIDTTTPFHHELDRLTAENAALQQRIATLESERDAAQAVERSLRYALMQAPAMISVMQGQDHMMLLSNQQNLDLIGKTDAIIGQAVQVAFPEPEYLPLIQMLDRVYTSGEAVTGKELPVTFDDKYTGQRKDVWLDFVYTPLRDEAGQVCGVIHYSVDVTDKVVARQSVEQLNSELEQRIAERTAELARQADDLRLFRTLTETIPDAVVVAQLDGQIIYANPAYYRQFAVTSARPGSLADTVAPEEQVYWQRDILPRLLNDGSWRGRIQHTRADGGRFPGDDLGVVIRNETGQATYIAGVLRDITQQVAQEQEREFLQHQVISAQRDALRELSTPLIPITEDVVIMPLIGTIDSHRAQLVMETLLEGVAQYQASLVILDITGVRVVDTQVAQAFIQAAQAVRLLGAQVMLTGIGAQIAQTLVHLGVDLSGILTRGTLQAGIGEALGQNGLHAKPQRC